MTATQTYAQALKATRATGTMQLTDPQFMALFCDTAIQSLCGAVSPQLVWEGAQSKGMTTKDLERLAHTDKTAVAELMWI